MTWLELRPETRQVLLDAIDRAEKDADSITAATALDSETRELVESLLKAQEVNNG